MNEDKTQAEEFASTPVILDKKPSEEEIAKRAKEKVEQVSQRPTEPSSLGRSAIPVADPTKRVLKEDVARQREGRDPDDVMDEIVSSGRPVQYGDSIISPAMVQQARPERGNITNNDGYLRMRSIIYGEEGPKTGVILPQVKDDKPFIPETVAEKYHGYVPKWKRQAMARIYVDNNLKESGVDDDTRKIIAEEFIYGGVATNIKRRVQESFRGLTQLPRMAFSDAPSAISAMYRAGTANVFSPEFEAEFDATRPDRAARAEAYNRYIQDFDLNSGASGVATSVTAGLATLPLRILSGNNLTFAEEVNGMVHESLEERYKDNPDVYAKKAFEVDPETGEFLLDKDGERIKKKFVTDENAQFMMDAAFETLRYVERGTVIVGEETAMNVLTGGGLTSVRAAGRMKKLQKFKQENATALAGIDDPEDILAYAGKQLNFTETDKFFKAGLYQYRVDESSQILKRNINTVEQRILALSSKANRTPKDEQELAQARIQLKQYRQTKRNAYIRGRFVPYVKDSFETAAVVGAGAFLFREHGFFFDDENTREFAGLMFMSFGGYKLGGVGRTALGASKTGAKRVAEYVVPPVPEMIAAVVRHLPVVGDVLVDSTAKNIEDFLVAGGTAVTAETRRNIEVLVGAYAKFDPRTRRKAIEGMKVADKQYNDIVNAFPEGAQREEARELFFQNYNQSGNILALAALDRLAKDEVDITGITGKDIEKLETNLRESTRLIRATELSLNRFFELTDTVPDEASRNMLRSWVETRRSGLANLATQLREQRETELQYLDKLEKSVIGSNKIYTDGQMRTQLAKMRVSLQNALGQDMSESDALRMLDEKINKDIDDSVATLEPLRAKSSSEATLAASKTLEKILSQQLNRVYTDGSKPYKELEQIGDSMGSVDITPVFETLLEKDNFLGIRRYFGPSSELFRSVPGRHALAAFTEMRKRAMPDETLDALRQEFITANKKDPNRGMSENEVNALSDHDFFLEVLRRNKIAAQKTGQPVQFSPFEVANPYEIDLMYNAFKKAGEQAEERGNSALAREFFDFADSIDNTIANQNPQFYAKLNEARNTYRRLYGEATEEGGLLANFVEAQLRQKSAKTIADSTAGAAIKGTTLDFVYKEGQTPFEIVEEMGSVFVEYLRPGGSKSVLGAHQVMDRFVMSMANPIEGTNVKGFDLTDPEQFEYFTQLREIIGTMVTSGTADKVLDSFRRVKSKQGMRLTGIKGGFDAESIGDMETLTKLLQVPVRRTKDGPIESEALFDVADMYSSQNTLQRAIDTNEEVSERFLDLKDSFKSNKQDAKSEITLRIDTEEEELKLFSDIVETFNSKDFYEQYIVGTEGGSLQLLKDNVIETMMNAGDNMRMSREEAEKFFNRNATEFIISGMMDAAGMSPVKGRVPGGVDGEVYREFENPEVLLEMLTNKDTRAQLEVVMESEHIDFITNIVRYVNESHLSVKVAKPSGVIKPMTLASKVSRAWNLARGVVSPIYVAADYMFTAAKAGQVEVLKLAVQDKNAAKVMMSFFEPMELMAAPSQKEMERFNDAAKTFLFTELARTGQEMDLIDAPEREQKRETIGQLREELETLDDEQE
jgi:hypothetical protein